MLVALWLTFGIVLAENHGARSLIQPVLCFKVVVLSYQHSKCRPSPRRYNGIYNDPRGANIIKMPSGLMKGDAFSIVLFLDICSD